MTVTRGKIIGAKVTDEEHRMVWRAAKKRHLKVSTWIRMILLEEIERMEKDESRQVG